MSFIKEFKEFSIKGNVIDMAVGVIIGGAFGKIVTSLVNDIIMPLISKITGEINFTNLKIVLTQENKEKGIEQITLNYGNFIQNIVDFIIIALCIFAFIKVINSLKKQEEEIEEAKEDEPTKEEVLLTEIRDLLKQK